MLRLSAPAASTLLPKQPVGSNERRFGRLRLFDAALLDAGLEFPKRVQRSQPSELFLGCDEVDKRAIESDPISLDTELA